ncbi:hypothetical protein FJT64_016637 [Amphibalanus amphitrite]|nr:hypothetical protein FJT64_016637 [Amphibalanus amphitrite]
MEREIDTSFLTPQEVGDGSLQTRKVNQLSSEDAYMQAKKRLTDRYGNAFITANEFKKRLYKWPEVKVDDIVLVVDDERPRSEWPLARVVATHPSGDHLVRKVRVLLGGSEYERPVHRLVLLLRRDCT